MAAEHLIIYGNWHLTNKLVYKNLNTKLFTKQINHETFMNVLLAGYTDKRYYHTFRHIKYMLTHTKDFFLSPREEAKLELAIWFHDVVYNAKEIDNEMKSSLVFYEYAKRIDLRKKETENIVQLILDTTHKESPKTRLGKIICDLDLREMSEPEQINNTPKIRKEYSHLSDGEFDKGRKAFLENMLNKKYIYNTDDYRESLEAQARHNLTVEMESINQ